MTRISAFLNFDSMIFNEFSTRAHDPILASV